MIIENDGKACQKASAPASAGALPGFSPSTTLAPGRIPARVSCRRSIRPGPRLDGGFRPLRDARCDENQELGVLTIDRFALEQPAETRDLRQPRHPRLGHRVVQLEDAADD